MGTFFIVSTPIGNIEDITIRALKTLFQVSLLACEDTRVTGQLLELLRQRYGNMLSNEVKPTLVSYRNTNETNIVPTLIKALEEDKSVALVSDAGTPLVSDPGYRIVQELMKRNIKIEIVPGVSAFLTALTGSGLPIHHFTFLGFLPEKTKHRKDMLLSVLTLQDTFASTYICYVAPHKLQQTLEDMNDVFGNIEIHIARELTKMYEEYWKGMIHDAMNHFSHPKGEFVLLFQLPRVSLQSSATTP
jgi:16S rRNA (cytidine1402-2'-O)-methyltransferase